MTLVVIGYCLKAGVIIMVFSEIRFDDDYVVMPVLFPALLIVFMQVFKGIEFRYVM